MSLTNLVQTNASRNPNGLALVEGDRRLTYAELARRSQGLAAGLAEQGVQPGDVVGILIGNRIEHAEALLAIGRAGGIAMAIDAHWRGSEVEDALGRFGAKAFLVEEDAYEGAAAAWKAASGGKPAIVTGRGGDISFESLAARTDDCDRRPGAEAPYLIMLSSGTTGKPKGALVSHGGMMFRFLAQVIEYGLGRDEIYLNSMPLYHGGGRSFTLTHLYLGATTILTPRFSPAESVQLIHDWNVTTTHFVPTMLHRILALPDVQPWPTVRRQITSGAPLPAAEREGVLSRLTPNLVDYYGAVEAGGISILWPADQARKPGSVGRPMWGTEVRIDGEDGAPAKPGEIGEIRYRSPGMCSGYVGGMGNEAFLDGWYRTGDLGYFDDEGYLYLAGRSKEMIITGGVNVFPAEIEGVLREFSAVAQAAVIGTPDPEWGERVVAFVTPRPGATVDTDSLAEFLRGRLAGSKRPKAIHVLPDLPKASSSKVDRNALRAIARGE